MREYSKTDEFMAIYTKHLAIQNKVELAYHAAELEWYSMYGYNFYKSYGSFRAAKVKYRKRKSNRC